MHELSYVINFINIAEQELPSDAVPQTLEVTVGEMTGVMPEFLHKYYPDAVKGTRLEGSDLKVNLVPVTANCLSCGKDYHPGKENGYSCPHCGSKEAKLLRGRECEVTRVHLI